MRPKHPSHTGSILIGSMMTICLAACTGSTSGPVIGPQTGNVTEYALNSDPSTPSRPLGVAVGPDRNIWFTEFDADGIGVLNLSTLAITHYPLPSAGSNPTHLMMGPDGRLWFTETGPMDTDPTDTGPNNLGQITSDGEISEIQLPVNDSDPTGITLGPDGNVWFTEGATGDVRRSTAEGSISDPILTTTGTSMPGGIVTGPDASLWFTEASSGIVGHIVLPDILSEFPLSNAGSSPTEVIVGNDGNLWFSESQNSKIGRITPAGTIAEFTTPTGGSVPEGMTLGPDCNVWITETNANLIGRIDKNGTITEFTIPTANSQPVGITLGPDGNLWFAESAANQIAKLVPPAGSSSDCATVALPPVAKCQDAKVDTDPGTCTAASASIDNGTFDPQNLAFTETTAPGGPYNLGTSAATLTARRSPVIAAACAAQIEVDDTEAPKLTCPGAVVQECTSPAGATAALTPTATDNCPNLGIAQCTGSGGTFALGTTSVNCSVTDGSHNTSTCVTSVTVKDTTPPVISSVSASPAVLWPPDRKMIPVKVSVAVADTCDASVASRCKIISVGSDQRCDRSALRITGPLTVALVADRDGDGPRGYTIQVQCVDVSGNAATSSVTVRVPHYQGDGDDHDHDPHHGDDVHQRGLWRK